MKVYIHTDIEGIAGWVFYANFSTPLSAQNHAHTQRLNELLTAEVDAAAKAALDSGADEVWINDSHGWAYHILFERLPPQCQIMHGRGGYFDAWLSCFDASVDALVCIGMHAMGGTPHAVCPHSVWHVNDGAVRLSEGTMAAALAGTFDVPCVCASGDDKVCAEFAEKMPGCETVTVKWGLAAQNARSLMPAAAQERIYAGVCSGLEHRADIAPYRVPGPYRLNLSDRDPEQKAFPEDVTGTDLWETFHRAVNTMPYGNFGSDPLDDRSYRWPT